MTNQEPASILAVNCGSSSLKCALFRTDGEDLRPLLAGRAERIGAPNSRLLISDARGEAVVDARELLPDHPAAARECLAALFGRAGRRVPDAVGHRVVHGGTHYTTPQRVTPELLSELHQLEPLDPEHLPQEIAVIRSLQRAYPEPPHIACFDTCFHRQMPKAAQMYPLTAALFEEGIIRFGFHGLSCEFIVEELERQADRPAAHGRVVIAHLGNGASMTAVHNGRSIDTTMGFTPAAGLMMSRRCGDIDPGILLHLMRNQRLTLKEVSGLATREAGLLGISGISSDVRDLLEREAGDARAADALELFCYIARKFLGAMAAALGGLDTLVFTAGIGENSPEIRRRICAHMEFLGIHLDASRNQTGSPVISASRSPVTVRVMHTNEELMIARHAARLLRAEAAAVAREGSAHG